MLFTLVTRSMIFAAWAVRGVELVASHCMGYVTRGQPGRGNSLWCGEERERREEYDEHE